MIRRFLCFIGNHSAAGPVEMSPSMHPIYCCRHCRTYMYFDTKYGWFVDTGRIYKEKLPE